MHRILLSKEADTIIESVVPHITKELIIISAFCKLDAIKKIDALCSSEVKKYLLLRFLPSDISSGATDSEVYSFCKLNNWRVFVDYSLHAKVYVFDREKCIIGSANATNKGLGIAKRSNKEASVLMNIEHQEFIGILSLFDDSLELTDELFDEIVGEMDDLDVVTASEKRYKDCYSNISSLAPSDFPLGQKMDIIELSQLKSYKWLVNYLKTKENHQSFYGEIVASLHDAFETIPKHLRKDVKLCLSNLLSSIELSGVCCISITKPNYSQCVSLIDDYLSKY